MSEPSAVLRIGDEEIELPMVVGTEDERGIDISKLRAQTGVITLDYGFVNTGCVRVGDHLHRRRGGHPALPRHPDRAARRARRAVVPRDLVPAHLRRAARPATQLDEFRFGIRRHTLLHEDVKRFFDGFPKDAHPMAILSAVVSALSTFYQDSDDPHDPDAGAALDPAADGQAPDDRGLRVQEVDRPAVPLPRQPARPHRELPHDDVRGAVGAVRGRPRPSCTRSSSC